MGILTATILAISSQEHVIRTGTAVRPKCVDAFVRTPAIVDATLIDICNSSKHVYIRTVLA